MGSGSRSRSRPEGAPPLGAQQPGDMVASFPLVLNPPALKLDRLFEPMRPFASCRTPEGGSPCWSVMFA